MLYGYLKTIVIDVIGIFFLQVDQANGKLATITWKIKTFEEQFPDPDNEVFRFIVYFFIN